MVPRGGGRIIGTALMIETEESERHSHNPIVRYFKLLGPGLVTGASDDDPSGITTYSVAGASLGYSMLWTALATFPLMAAVQLMCARIGLVTGRGLAGALRHHYPRPFLYAACLVLLVANVFNIAADLALPLLLAGLAGGRGGEGARQADVGAAKRRDAARARRRQARRHDGRGLLERGDVFHHCRDGQHPLPRGHDGNRDGARGRRGAQADRWRGRLPPLRARADRHGAARGPGPGGLSAVGDPRAVRPAPRAGPLPPARPPVLPRLRGRDRRRHAARRVPDEPDPHALLVRGPQRRPRASAPRAGHAREQQRADHG